MATKKKGEIEFRFKKTKGRPGALIVGTIVGVKGRCWMGQKVGDTFELDGTVTGGLCGHLYHSIYPYLIMLEYGGSFPDDVADEWPGDRPEFVCPDAYNQVRIQLRRADTPEGRHPLYIKEMERDEKQWRRKLAKESTRKVAEKPN
jgi:uncharacterized repeat protein (TIGR04076 family)